MNKQAGSARIVLLSVIGLFVLLIAAFVILKPNGKPTPESREVAVPVSVMTAHLTNTIDVVYLPALVMANVDATLSAEKAGRIVGIHVDRGDRVQEGQLLLQIDARIWQANLKQVEIAAEDAARNYERIQSLMDAGAISQSDYDAAEKAYIQTASAAEEARINIEQCRVESPINGIVNDRFVEAGEYVQPGLPLFQVIDQHIVKAVVQIPEKDIHAIEAGDRMLFNVNPFPNRHFEGEVTFVAAQADSRNNAFRTEITIVNQENLLRPGMIAQVEFHRGINENMISLPMAAVLPSKGEHIVYLVKDGQAVRRQVKIESIARTHALISEGVDDGDLVIVEGNRTLTDGQRVEIMETESPAE